MLNEVLAKNVVVLGAGTMGSGIAAHLANLGFNVSLLDANQERVVDAFEKAKVARPPHFYVPERANDVRLGNTQEHLEWIRSAGWVIEAIVERMEFKRALYAQIEPYLAPDVLISTNTSGLPLAELTVGRSETFRRRFLGTHFFNPPRYLKLLELIPTSETDPALVTTAIEFLESKVARRVVLAKDTPGFIANRFGMWSMFHAIHVAEKLQLSPEQVDAITGPFIGRPKTGSFRLADLVGLDVMRDISTSLHERCPQDPHITTLRDPSSLAHLVSKVWIGDKVGQGYYRRQGQDSLVFDLITHAYREPREVKFRTLEELSDLPLPERIARALEQKDEAGEFLRLFLLPSLKYAEHLKQEISHSVQDFDRVMQWGFGWQMGPFATIDAISGTAAKKHFQSGQILDFGGNYVTPKSEPAYQTLKDFEVLSRSESLVLRDLGDGVTSLGISTKLGMVTPTLVEELISILEDARKDQFVLAHEGRGFSVGFDLKFFNAAIQEERWSDIERAIRRLHHLGEVMEKRRVVAAVNGGYCLGGGLEVALATERIVAHAETQIGFPEAKVGLIPGGRGTVVTRQQNQHTAQRLAQVALNLIHGRIAPNADVARQYGYLRSTDLTCYHPDRVLMTAKEALFEARPAIRPLWAATVGPLVGMIDRELEIGKKSELTEYDLAIGQKIKNVFARSSSYEEATHRERQEFLELCTTPATQARIRHMVETGKPLRN